MCVFGAKSSKKRSFFLSVVTIQRRDVNSGEVFRGFVIRAKQTSGDTDELIGYNLFLFLFSMSRNHFDIKICVDLNLSPYTLVHLMLFQENLGTFLLVLEVTFSGNQRKRYGIVT